MSPGHGCASAPGQALARTLAVRGIKLTPDQAADLTRLLLDLAVAGVLQPRLPTHPLPTDLPEPPIAEPGAVHRRRPPGLPTAVVRSEEPGPTVYNMGPSIHQSCGDES